MWAAVHYLAVDLFAGQRAGHVQARGLAGGAADALAVFVQVVDGGAVRGLDHACNLTHAPHALGHGARRDENPQWTSAEALRSRGFSSLSSGR